MNICLIYRNEMRKSAKKNVATVHQTPGKERNLLELTEEDRFEFFKSFDIILMACDGVLWMYGEPLPNVGQALTALKLKGKQVKFITNDNIHSEDKIQIRISKIGYGATESNDIIQPSKTISRYLHRNNQGMSVFSLCGYEFNESLKKNGITVLNMAPDTSLTLENFVPKVKPDNRVCAVITDINFNLTYGELARGQQYLKNENCALIVASHDTFIPLTKDMTTIGNGGFVNILRDLSGKEPIVLGKPGPLIADELMDMFGLFNRRRILYVGGNLTVDIEFAVKCGFQSLFVLSGSSTKEQMLRLPDDLKPDYILNSMADFIFLCGAMVPPTSDKFEN